MNSPASINCAAWAGAMLFFFALTQNAQAQAVYTKSVKGQADYRCQSRSSTSSFPLCGSKQLRVAAYPVYDVDGVFTTCIAVLPYNAIMVHTGGNGDSITLEWVPAQRNVKFLQPYGILFSSPLGTNPGKLFLNITTAGDLVTATTNPNLKLSQLFNHHPMVEMTIGVVTKPCDPIDPVFVNSAD